MMLKVPAPAERAIWGLVRAGIAAGGWQRRVAEAVADALRPPEDPPLPGQRALWVVDAEGLPPRPWRLDPDDVFDCRTLGCRGLKVRECVVRQIATDVQRTTQASRGQGTIHPSCDSRKCAQGRGNREALDREADVTWRGRGPGKRWDRGGSKGACQLAARSRLAAVGMLDSPPSLDEPPEEVEA